jgi:hypothetical protein
VCALHFRLTGLQLSPDGWCRNATLVGAGRPIERTVHDYADGPARHEHANWKQVENTVHALVVGETPVPVGAERRSVSAV